VGRRKKVSEVRAPAVAGLFYPGEPGALRAAVEGYLAEAEAGGEAPKALVVPHAGYVYSGPIAASAYVRLAPLRERVSRVVLLGPAHRVAFRGLAVPGADAFETPLGRVELDRAGIETALALPQVVQLDAAHREEHSLEVQLPFLQRALAHFRLVPLVVGDATPREVSAVIEALWGGDETLVVVSSDLSHYLPYDEARALDLETSRAIEALEPEAIGHDQACGRLPVQGLLLSARRHGLRARTLDLRCSGDTAGPRDSVVGYGAYVFA
jgi:AmmeMemoRadiSam system protein B